MAVNLGVQRHLVQRFATQETPDSETREQHTRAQRDERQRPAALHPQPQVQRQRAPEYGRHDPASGTSDFLQKQSPCKVPEKNGAVISAGISIQNV